VDALATAAIARTVTDDRNDLALARDGDHTAFARIYDRHAAVIMSLCRRNAPREADDAMQETFIRAYERLDRLRDPDQLRPWLYTIARRVCSERHRSNRRRTRREEAVSMNGHARTIEPEQDEPSARLDDLEQLDRLDLALDALDERERLAVHLHYLDPDPVRAAKEALGISRSGYYKLLDRARRHLASLMGERPRTAGPDRGPAKGKVTP
jgi:RNA polymerase sigma-70 factor (ECF subfamily)